MVCKVKGRGLVWFYGISAIVVYLMPNLVYIYIYIWFGLVGFYGISTVVGYLMPNPLYTGTLNIYIICKHILYMTFVNEPELFFAHC